MPSVTGDPTQVLRPRLRPAAGKLTAVAGAQVTPGGHLPAVSRPGRFGRTAAARGQRSGRSALQVQQLDGVDVRPNGQQQPAVQRLRGDASSRQLGRRGRRTSRLAVLGPGEGATFRLTSLAPARRDHRRADDAQLRHGRAGRRRSANWRGCSARSEPGRRRQGGAVRHPLRRRRPVGLVSAGIDEKPGGATGAVSGGLAGIVSEAVFGLPGRRDHSSPADRPPGAGLRGDRWSAPGLEVVADQLAEAKYLDDLLSGADTVSVQLTPALRAPRCPGGRTAPAP